MVMAGEAHQKVTTAHLSRLAYLYVRQSTLRQVFEQSCHPPGKLRSGMAAPCAQSLWRRTDSPSVYRFAD